MYDNIVETLSNFDASPGFGCILAHSMGLGKTLQVISFVDVFLRFTSARTVLCVVPVSGLTKGFFLQPTLLVSLALK